VCSHICLIGMFRAPLFEADGYVCVCVCVCVYVYIYIYKKNEFTVSLMCTGPKKSKLI